MSFAPELEVPAEKTGVWRAATLLAEALGVEPRVRVEVTARIPERAGLGGSSADAGATLRALADLWGVSPLDPRVLAVARRAGADVAFFLDPRPSLFAGAGDVRVRTFPALEVPLALVMPRADGGSTVEAYAEYDRTGTEPVSYEPICAALAARDVAAVAARLHNNLGPAAPRPLPGDRDRGDLAARAAGGACGAGHGLGHVLLCHMRERGDGRRACPRAQEFGWRAWSTKTVGSERKVC